MGHVNQAETLPALKSPAQRWLGRKQALLSGCSLLWHRCWAAASRQLLPEPPELIAVLGWLDISQPADQGKQILRRELAIFLPLQCSRSGGTPSSHPGAKDHL
ncbi:MAG: hypothetical protein VKM97_06180 [Cyanobacteriota bacterium]|nr:hypothetical protein [Cyanobacteriota bacterium]